MKKSLFTLGFFILTQCPFTVFGDTGDTGDKDKVSVKCEKFQQNTDKHSRCLDGIKDSLERELQTWINHHTLTLEDRALVNGRHSALKIFKRSQNNFVTYRDNNCRWRYLAIISERGADSAYKRCYIRLTQNRIDDLSVTHY